MFEEHYANSTISIIKSFVHNDITLAFLAYQFHELSTPKNIAFPTNYLPTSPCPASTAFKLVNPRASYSSCRVKFSNCEVHQENQVVTFACEKIENSYTIVPAPLGVSVLSNITSEYVMLPVALLPHPNFDVRAYKIETSRALWGTDDTGRKNSTRTAVSGKVSSNVLSLMTSGGRECYKMLSLAPHESLSLTLNTRFTSASYATAST